MQKEKPTTTGLAYKAFVLFFELSIRLRGF